MRAGQDSSRVGLASGKLQFQVDSRHPHGKEANHAFVIERLEDVPTDERVVDSGIFVLAEIGQVVLANVHHSLWLCLISVRQFVSPVKVSQGIYNDVVCRSRDSTESERAAGSRMGRLGG